MKSNRHDNIPKKFMRAGGVSTAITILVSSTMIGGSGINTALASTEGTAEKSESVYVNVDANGKTEQEIVSDWLHDDTSGAVVADRSDLSGITNVKGEEKPQISGNSVTWTLSGNDLYYQGKTNRSLPVSVTLQYFLNGQPIAPSELAGKSGKFELKISFQNSDAHSVVIGGQDKTIYTPFACMAALNLPKKYFSNVTTNFGNVLSDGNNQAVSFLSFPGLKQSFDMIDFSSATLPDELDVTADVQNFTLGPVMMVAAPVPDMDSLKNMNTSDLNGLSDKLKQLIDAGTQLKDATGTLNSGEKAFADGVGQLFQGIGTAGASFDKIVNGAHTLNSAAGNSKKGIPALIGGANTLSSGAGQLTGGLDKLYAQFQTGTAKSPTLKDSVGSLNGGAQQLASGLGQLFSQFSPAGNGQTATLYDRINQLNAGESQYASLSNGLLFGMAETNLQTLQGTLTSVLTPVITQTVTQQMMQQGVKDPNIIGQAVQKAVATGVTQALTQAVTQELTGLHGAADASLIQYMLDTDNSKKATDYGYFCEYANLYDILNILTNDSDVVNLPSATQDQQTAKEKAFESVMGTAASSSPAPYFYSFDKSALVKTLPAANLSGAETAALTAAAATLSDGNLKSVVDGVNQQNIVLAGTGLENGTSALAAQFKTAVSGQSATLYDSVKALNDGAQQLKAGTGAFAAQTVTSGNASSPTLFDSIGALDKGAKTLSSGTTTLAAGASNLTKLTSGIQSLENALGLFRGGLSTIHGGASTLNENAAKLVNGTTQLNDGMNKFCDQGLSKLQDIDTGKIEQALQVKDEMIKLADNYTNFSGVGDGMSSNVKFILKTDEIKTPDNTVSANSSSTSQTHLSFWQKVGNWFHNLFHAKQD